MVDGRDHRATQSRGGHEMNRTAGCGRHFEGLDGAASFWPAQRRARVDVAAFAHEARLQALGFIGAPPRLVLGHERRLPRAAPQQGRRQDQNTQQTQNTDHGEHKLAELGCQLVNTEAERRRGPRILSLMKRTKRMRARAGTREGETVVLRDWRAPPSQPARCARFAADFSANLRLNFVDALCGARK